MDFKIDKGVPLPKRVRSHYRFKKLLADMEDGDSVLFPWHKKEDGRVFKTAKGQRVSVPANHFMRFLKDRECKCTSRGFEGGRRVWLLERGEPDCER